MIQKMQKKKDDTQLYTGYCHQIFSCIREELSRRITIIFQITKALSSGSDLNYYSLKNTPPSKTNNKPKESIKHTTPEWPNKRTVLAKSSSIFKFWSENSYQKLSVNPTSNLWNEKWYLKKKIWNSERGSDVNQKLFSFDMLWNADF